MFKIKFVDFASFICLFGQTHNRSRETLCSWVRVFVFYLNLLHHVVMLGLKHPYHKKHSPERRLGSSWQRIMGRTIEELEQYSWTDLRDPHLLANFSHNYAKIQNTFE